MIDQLIAQGTKLMNDEQYEEAVAKFEMAVQKDNSHVEARYHLALAHNKLSNYPKSLKIFKALIDEHPSNPDYLSERGVIYFNIGQLEKSLTDLDAAVSLEPEYGYRYSSRAYVKERTGDLEGAIEDYKVAIALDEEDIIAKNNLELAEDKLAYKNKDSQKKQRTKYHLTDEEIEEYREKYVAKNGKPGSPSNEEKEKRVTEVSLKNLFSEMGGVFTSRKKMSEFLKFIKNGFSHSSR